MAFRREVTGMCWDIGGSGEEEGGLLVLEEESSDRMVPVRRSAINEVLSR